MKIQTTMNKSIFTAAMVAATAGAALAGPEADALDAALLSQEKSIWDRFSFGTYGEIHSTFTDSGTDIDPHRIVLFADFQFTDKLKIVTETELEHAYRKKDNVNYFTSAGVELKLEQAYLEYTFDNDVVGKAGLILAPVGRINEVHEPTTFYGVERPNVEKRVIPTTWTVLGIGAGKKIGDDWQVDGLFHGGNDTRGGSIRGGRSRYGIDLFKVNSDGNQFAQNQSSWAATGRAKYSGFENVTLSGSLQYQSDMDSTTDGAQNGVLTEAHGIYRNGGFQFIALGTAWNIDVEGSGGNQWGYYFEPSYAWDTSIGKVGVFARASQYQYADVSDNSEASKSTDYNFGGNYWLNENLVVKADYQLSNTKNKGNNDSMNLGFGWYY